MTVTSFKAAKASNLVLRVLTTAVVVPPLLWLVLGAPKWLFFVFLLIVVAVTSFELLKMIAPLDRILQVWAVLSGVGVFSCLVAGDIGVGRVESALAVLPVILTLAGFVIGLLRAETSLRVASVVPWLVAAPLYVGGLMSTVARLHLLDNGGGWVLLSLMLAWFGDTAAYFTGRAFGRHKLFESVSPTKTVEGALGGLAGSMMGVLLAHYWFLPELPLVGGLALAIVAGGLGQAGDLCESLIKRATGVKDSGSLIPGHGGFLDRIDAVLFTSATTWLYTVWFR